MPVCYPQCAGESYRPSNGTEGEFFHEQFCYRCRHDVDDHCEILTAALLFDKDESDYPKEWVYDKEGRPTCLAFHDVQSNKPAHETRCEHTPDMFE